MTLPQEAKARKKYPITSGVLDYFPDAIAAVARVSYVGNEQHNPGEPLHWSREKSSDHQDCIARHLIERGGIDTDGVRHTAKLAWRALALLQLEIEAAEEIDLHEPGDLKSVLVQADRWAETEAVFTGDELVAGEAIEVSDPAQIQVFTHGGDAFVGDCDHTKAEQPREPVFYVAGPMRGYPEANFPAFDEARDRGIALGYGIISPADMDRVNGIDGTEGDEEYSGADMARQFVTRDTAALLSLRAELGDGIALLPGWERSTGATAEFFVARWLGLRVVSAVDFQPIEDTPDVRSMMCGVVDYLDEVDFELGPNSEDLA